MNFLVPLCQTELGRGGRLEGKGPLLRYQSGPIPCHVLQARGPGVGGGGATSVTPFHKYLKIKNAIE